MDEIMRSFWRGVRQELARRAETPCSLPCCWPPSSERARVAAEQDHPRLRVWRAADGARWLWTVSEPDGTVLDYGMHGTHAEALAVGLAALEVASLAGSTP